MYKYYICIMYKFFQSSISMGDKYIIGKKIIGTKNKNIVFFLLLLLFARLSGVSAYKTFLL